MAQIDLITQNDQKSPVSEAYRAIRTNIQFAGAGKSIKLISFTSATPGEGKSTTISNLACAMAQDGKKVLLIDCDMRKPVQHKKFGLKNHGLSNYIATGESFSSVVNREVFPNLDVLTSGPVTPNPSELLGSPKMEDLLKSVANQYDYVLIDMPPILAVTDAAVLGSKVDGVIVVVASGANAPEDMKQSKQRLLQSGSNILGVVLNKMPQRKSSGYGYGYGYYYYYYDESHQKHTGHRKSHQHQ